MARTAKAKPNPLTPAADAAGPADPTGSPKVYVRMYRALGAAANGPAGMLGDCFLIRIVGEQDGAAVTSHILIDCGMLLGSVDAVTRMQAIADDIVKQTGGTATTPGVLDLLVVTHEHWDHISGFSQAEETLLNKQRLQVANLWMGWTEKDGDPQVDRLRARFDRAGFAVAALVERIEAPGAALAAADKTGSLRSLKGFLGAAEPKKKRLGGREVMAAIKRHADQCSFLEPGTVLPTPTARDRGPSLRAYVLGPPRDEKRLFKDKPSSGDQQETYIDEGGKLSDMLFRVAASGEPSVAGSGPFEAHYNSIDASEVENKARQGTHQRGDAGWIAARYFAAAGLGQTRAQSIERRRIDDDWLGAADSLALKLDSDTNNTSLALAFDLPDGTSMVFAADAQVGNWESWHDQFYTDETGKVHTAEQILNRTRFYKVGHHGSHNATARGNGLEMMTRDDLVAAIPTDEEFGKRQGAGGWQMPNPRVNKALIDRTKGRILRNDRRYDRASRTSDPELKLVAPGFFDRLTEDVLFLEYRVI